MNKVLRKRLGRELRSNSGRYLALVMLIIMGVFLVVSMVGSADSIIDGTDLKAKESNVQDGQFSVFVPLDDAELEILSEGGNIIEPEFYIDMPTEDGKVLRLFKDREKTDLVNIAEGRKVNSRGETVIERRFAEVNGYKVGDSITAGGVTLEIVGIGSVPDYDAPMRNLSDTGVQSEVFGLLFVTKEEYENICDNTPQKAQEYTYSYRLGENISDDELKAGIKDLDLDYTKVGDKYLIQALSEAAENDAVSDQNSAAPVADNLTSFIKASDNGRIAAAAGDVIMNKVGGLIAGVIVLILFAYVISVFVVHQIDQESSIIGALYSLGVKKKDLLVHYISVPAAVAFVGGLFGTLLAFTPFGIGMQMSKSYSYYSLPDVDTVFPPYLIIYGLIMPPLISAAVNTLVINKRLSQTALSLIRSEHRTAKYRQFNIRSRNFERVFRIRQMMRELRSSIAVVLGMVISMLVITLGLNTYSLCTDVRDRNIADTKYEYMYLYKYPEKQIPEGGEAAYVEGLDMQLMGYTLEVSVIGIDGSSRYFDALPEKGKDKAVINNSLAERLGYKKGDRVTFSDKASDTEHTFTVTGIAEYSPGFTLFMDRESMCELFGRKADYYNAVYSDRELDIEEGRLYSVTTKDEIRKSAGVFIDQMTSFIAMLLIAGSVIFCVVMYLMMNVMIDRSSFGISLIKIFGYRPKEIRSLYLNGNLIVVAVGGLLAIPAAKFLIDLIYPMFVANVACCMDISYKWYVYVLIYCIMMLVYLMINKLLVRKISKISPAEVLKNRE